MRVTDLAHLPGRSPNTLWSGSVSMVRKRWLDRVPRGSRVDSFQGHEGRYCLKSPCRHQDNCLTHRIFLGSRSSNCPRCLTDLIEESERVEGMGHYKFLGN